VSRLITRDAERHVPRPHSAADTLARGLGWFSIALGAAEVFAPQTLTRAIGMQGSESLVQAYGAREMRDYRHRSGFRGPTAAMFGAARDFEMPRDFQTPQLLRAYTE
jgi:hypothetical protein